METTTTTGETTMTTLTRNHPLRHNMTPTLLTGVTVMIENAHMRCYAMIESVRRTGHNLECVVVQVGPARIPGSDERDDVIVGWNLFGEIDPAPCAGYQLKVTDAGLPFKATGDVYPSIEIAY